VSFVPAWTGLWLYILIAYGSNVEREGVLGSQMTEDRPQPITMVFSTPRNQMPSNCHRVQNSPHPSIFSNGDDRDDSSEVEEVTLDKPILAINFKNKFLGAALWNPTESTLVILADIQCANVVDMLDLRISLHSPG
jgi:hypothetical protein